MRAPTVQLRAKWAQMRARDGEDGSGGGMSLVLLLVAIAMLTVLGLVVDGGVKSDALDRADRVAMEAARAGAQAISGSGGTLNEALADSAVQSYLSAEGVPGSSQINGNQVIVHVSITEPTKILSVVGINEIHVTGDGFANVIYTQGG